MRRFRDTALVTAETASFFVAEEAERINESAR